MMMNGRQINKLKKLRQLAEQRPRLTLTHDELVTRLLADGQTAERAVMTANVAQLLGSEVLAGGNLCRIQKEAADE